MLNKKAENQLKLQGKYYPIGKIEKIKAEFFGLIQGIGDNQMYYSLVSVSDKIEHSFHFTAGTSMICVNTVQEVCRNKIQNVIDNMRVSPVLCRKKEFSL